MDKQEQFVYIKAKVSPEVRDKFKKYASESKHKGGMSSLLGTLAEKQIDPNRQYVYKSEHNTALQEKDDTIQSLNEKSELQESTISEQASTIKDLEKQLGDAKDKLRNAEVSGKNDLRNELEIIASHPHLIENIKGSQTLINVNDENDTTAIFETTPTSTDIIRSIDSLVIQKGIQIDHLESEIQTIANHLGVSDTAEHIIQRIGEIQDVVRSHIQKLVARISQLKSHLEEKHQVIGGYKKQGFFGRLFRLTPTPDKDSTLIYESDKPEDVVLDETILGKDRDPLEGVFTSYETPEQAAERITDENTESDN